MRIRTIYSSKILRVLNPFKRIGGITLYPFIILDESYRGNDIKLTHEMIHIKQQQELLIIPFYILYVGAYIYNFCRNMVRAVITRETSQGSPYRQIPFEKEAYIWEDYHKYLEVRPRYNWTKYIGLW